MVGAYEVIKAKIPWFSISYNDLKPWSPSMAKIARELEKRGYLKIYLVHHPDKEEEARRFALRLIGLGIEVTVAADVRPRGKSFDEATPEELAKVSEAIREADASIVLVI